MRDITAIGEILIDLTQTGKNQQQVPVFAANPGGAPANVAVAASRLGVRTAFIGKVESVKPTLSPEASAFATELFDASTTNESLKKNHSLAEINACLDEIRTALNNIGERAY